MVKIEVKNLNGKKVKTLELADDVFGLAERNDDLVAQVYKAQYANQRKNTAHTKTRGEVRGSTRKPWKQKGTGRARTGSIRNPIWRSGGTVFGPRKERNYLQKINKKMLRLATKMVLSAKVSAGELVVLESFQESDNKTKKMAQALEKLNLIKERKLFTFGNKARKFSLATRNLAKSENCNLENLSVFNMLNSKVIITDVDSLKELEAKYSQSVKPSESEDK